MGKILSFFGNIFGMLIDVILGLILLGIIFFVAIILAPISIILLVLASVYYIGIALGKIDKTEYEKVEESVKDDQSVVTTTSTLPPPSDTTWSPDSTSGN